MAKKLKPSRFDEQAAIDALLKFGPAERDLGDLRDQANSTFQQTVASAQGAANGTIAQTAQAIPRVKMDYDRVIGQTKAQQALTNTDVAGLSGVSNTTKAAGSLEQSILNGIMGQTKASSLADLQTRKVSAEQGRAAAQQAAANQLKSDLTQIFKKRSQLSADKGLYTVTQSEKLADAAAEQQQQLDIANAQLSQQERNSIRTSGYDPDTGLKIPGGNADDAKPGGRTDAQKRADRKEASKVAGYVQSALGKAQELKAQGLSSDEVGQILQGFQTVPGSSVSQKQPVKNADGSIKYETTADGKIKKDKSGDPIPVTQSVSTSISGYKGNFDYGVASTVMDIINHGYVTKHNVKYLHDHGVNLQELGLPYKAPPAASGSIGGVGSGGGASGAAGVQAVIDAIKKYTSG